MSGYPQKWRLTLARLVWRLSSRRDRHLVSKAGLNDARTKRYVEIWREAAAELNATFLELPDGFCEARLGGRATRMRQERVMMDDPLTARLALSKPLVHQLLAERKLLVPAYCEFDLRRLDAAMAFLRSQSAPCVVKPTKGNAGQGVTANVRTDRDLTRAAAYGSIFSDRLLIERQIPGDSYRLLFLEGTLLDAIRRHPPGVVGDGRSTIKQLIAQENRRRTALHGKAVLALLLIDPDCRATLRSAGLSPGSVPERGRRVAVKTVPNANSETGNESVRHLVGEALVGACTLAASALGIRLAGVDVVTPDPALPLEKSGGAINEVNAIPGLHAHYQISNPERMVPVAIPILRRLLSADGPAPA